MNLLLTGAFAYTHEQIERLIQLGYCVHFMQQEAEELPLPASKVDAVVCNGLFLHHDIESFSRLRCIQLTSAGSVGFQRCIQHAYGRVGIVSTTRTLQMRNTFPQSATCRKLVEKSQSQRDRRNKNCCNRSRKCRAGSREKIQSLRSRGHRVRYPYPSDAEFRFNTSGRNAWNRHRRVRYRRYHSTFYSQNPSFVIRTDSMRHEAWCYPYQYRTGSINRRIGTRPNLG